MPLESNRRRFLKFAVAATAAPGAAAPADPLDPQALKKLRTQLSGSIIVPSDAAYDSARRVYYWNPTTEKTPCTDRPMREHRRRPAGAGVCESKAA
ncbi:MAG: twin-arginine translocation signal domain-containing protein [Acidobacteria bacterium]|nr:twin-arginine translocation signal domain-containing protein [Acidobacteriota bacterium]